jgi:hypothetical protein
VAPAVLADELLPHRLEVSRERAGPLREAAPSAGRPLIEDMEKPI